MASADQEQRRSVAFSPLAKLIACITKASQLCCSLKQRYEEAVVKDPSVASRVETLLKAMSYIVPWRLGTSQGMFEFGCSVTSIISLFNDYIIAKRCPASSIISKFPVTQQRLLWLLTVVESVEVVSEVVSQMFWREVGKWIVILMLQILKATLRLILLFKYQSRISTSPAVPSVDRSKAHAVPQDVIPSADGKPVAYKGARTGKIIRSLHGDPAIPYSQLQHFLCSADNDHLTATGATNGHHGSSQRKLTSRELIAEALHASRPLVHIAAMLVFKQSSWKPWVLSLLMDIVSLHLHGGLVKFKTSEPSEMLRRRLVLLLYLLRSPFYDNCSRKVILGILQFCSNKLPLGSWIAEPLMEYLPIWQQIYSYNWMT